MRLPIVRGPHAALLALALLPVSAAGVAAQPAAAPVTAFENVNVLPMDRERVVANQTVIVRDGRIEWVGAAAEAKIPAGARRIEGRGRYLMPGLAEMHAHVPPEEPSDEVLQDLLFLYVANGVTTIRGMLGAPYQLELRARLRSGELLGPDFYPAAPSLNGNSAPDPATGARLVREHHAAGYDLLKIHPGLSRATYDSIVAVARAVGITWAGHVPEGVGIDHALATRQSTIDHLDGYLEGAVSDAMKARIASPTDTVRASDIWRAIEPARFADLVRRTREAGIWNVPTMHLWESLFGPVPPESLAVGGEFAYVSKQQLANWIQQKRNYEGFAREQRVTPDDARRYLALRRQFLKALADAGAPLLMGTDTPQMFNVAGFALQRELRLAQAAGLTPWQVLESGTRNVGRYVAEELKQDGRFGMVAPGQRADLVLLEANPLEDLANLTRRAGVMVRGRWVSGAEIREGLAKIAAKHAGS